ncbi:MAG TPA: DNA primase [Patescibacteria group bacterium]|nr:DNA primase [Patescibacteria group bacterium]
MDQVDEVKKRVDVVDLISSYLTLKKAGRNYRACCPFHKEKTASFMVSGEKQIWYCFGCNQGGDVISFIEKIEGLDFPAALNLLADRAGVVLEKTRFENKGVKDRNFQMVEMAQNFFSYILNEHNAGLEAKQYLTEKRKLSLITLKEFSLGYAPTGPLLLNDFLVKKGYKQEELMKMGLITKNSYGKVTDKFRERIIFPIRNTQGKTVGFGGRIFKAPKDERFTPPKYLNSPQSDLYDKSSIVYGLYEAKDTIRESDLVIIVEGYMDVISSHQAGVKNVVASSGTALTSEQVRILSRYTKNIAFAFDTDEAGLLATKRAFELTKFEDINIKAIVIEGAKDPDELIQKDKNEWIKISKSPVPILDFYYNSLLKQNNGAKSTEDKKNISKEFLPIIRSIANDVEKAHWIKKISSDMNVNEKFIIDALDKIKVAGETQRKVETKQGDSSVKLKISKELLLLIFLTLYPKKISDFFNKVKAEDLEEENSKKLYNILNEWQNKGAKLREEIDFQYIKNKMKLSREEQVDFDLLFFLALSFFDGVDEKDITLDIDLLIRDVLKNKKEKRQREIELELAQIDKVKDKEKIKKLLRELQSLI